ncbi:hypothetical protein Anapl_07992 [Anas platyrhynchos]|uniref:Uncharacterized protein n=1 Tax=Anas platyrhynchos TaxID=8839 RepID=R0LRM1_ANAPL|nr:hypothetical protein Anapl_07992 [Anas platyrhynchos]
MIITQRDFNSQPAGTEVRVKNGRRYDNAGIWIEPVTDLLQTPGSYGFNCKHQTIAQLVVMLAKILQTKRAADVEPERALNSFKLIHITEVQHTAAFKLRALRTGLHLCHNAGDQEYKSSSKHAEFDDYCSLVKEQVTLKLPNGENISGRSSDSVPVHVSHTEAQTESMDPVLSPMGLDPLGVVRALWF